MIILNVSGYKTGGTWLHNILRGGTSNFRLIRDAAELKDTDVNKEYFNLPIQFGSLENFKKLNNAISLSKLNAQINVLDKVHFYSNDDSLVTLLVDSGIRFFIMERDYRDIIVSRFYHEIASGRAPENFSEFFEQKGKKFLIEAYNYNAFWMKVQQQSSNVYKIQYANLKNNYINELNNIESFLGETQFVSEKVLHLNNIDNNRKFHTEKWMSQFSDNGGDFYRKGVVGDYVNYFNSETLEEYERWLRDLKNCI